jgi:hypothetical protein
MELPKPDTRVAILDTQQKLTVEGIVRKNIDYALRTS